MARVCLGKVRLSDTELRGFEVGERMVLLSKVEGAYRAIDDWCNHAGCLLSGGRRLGRVVTCPCHDISFDLETGRNMTSPEICGDQSAFALEEQEGKLYLVIDLEAPKQEFK